ncbi:MAG: hypothetical protein Q9187_005212 [Circinaria calcarea]
MSNPTGRRKKPAMRAVVPENPPFLDHRGNPSLTVFCVPADNTHAPIFSFQVYVTNGLTATDCGTLPTELLDRLHSSGSGDFQWWRLDFYFLPGASKEDCMDHYRGEKEARKEDNDHHLVPSYANGYYHCYHNFIILVPEKDWENHGLAILSWEPAEGEQMDSVMEFQENVPPTPGPTSDDLLSAGLCRSVSSRCRDLYSLSPFKEEYDERWELKGPM